jgi:uncharacterized protein YjbJ (UPF0337 family)
MGSGTGDRIKGKAKEVAGTVTGDRKKETKGKMQQTKGKVTDKAEQKDRELRNKSGNEEGG